MTTSLAQLHDRCSTIISAKFGVPVTDLKTDCDAISILITTREMSASKIESLKSFFSLFGTDLTFRAGLPSIVPGSKKEEGIFGCSGNKCGNLPAFLNGKEMLVIDTPIKVALHKSCKTKLVKNLRKQQIYLTESNSEGLCFNQREASNKPSYKNVSDTIIESCYIDEARLHAIHIADFGMKSSIQPGSATCPGMKFFTAVKALRTSGFSVELLQYDVGFTIPMEHNKLIQISCSDNKKRKFGDQYGRSVNRSVLSKSSLGLFPLHNVPSKLVDKNTVGTVSIKKKIDQWKRGDGDFTVSQFDLDMEDSLCYEEDIQKWELICDIYRKETSNKNTDHIDTLSINPNTLYSVKMYSTISHMLMQKRMKFPLHFLDMYKIDKRSFKQLQKLTQCIYSANKEALSIVKENGVGLRIEFSIRPPPTKNTEILRNDGHYTDILVHVYLGVYDLILGSQYNMNIIEIDPQVVKTELLTLTSEIQPYLKMRDKLSFQQVYKNPRITAWLQAHLSLMLITTGLIPDFGVRFLKGWLRDKNRYDPYRRAKILGSIAIKNTNSDDSQPLSLEVSFRLKHLLKTLGFSTHGSDVLIDFINVFKPLQNARYWYEQIPYSDKLRLSMYLLPRIVPTLSHFMAKEVNDTDTNIMEQEFDNLSDQEIRKWERQDHWWIQMESEGNQRNRYKNMNSPKNPTCRAIHSLLQMGVFFDNKRPVFLRLLMKFILKCHSKNIVLIGTKKRLMQLQNKPSFKMMKRYIDQEVLYLSKNDISLICHDLEVTKYASEDRETCIKALCKIYGFPIMGITFKLTKNRNKNSSKQREPTNKILNKVMSWDLVTRIHTRGESSQTFFRNADNASITIMNDTRIIQHAKSFGSPVMKTLFAGKSGYEVMSECLNLSESPFQKRLRSSLHNFLSTKDCIQDLFLSQDGYLNTTFKGAKTLKSLEDLRNFRFLTSGKLSETMKSFNFPPQTILPIISLVYEINIMFYDMQKYKSYLYVYHCSRSITYTFPTEDVFPTIQCTLITIQQNGDYHWSKFLHSVYETTQSRYKDIPKFNHPHPNIGLFRSIKKTSKSLKKILPDHTRNRVYDITDALCNLMAKIKYDYFETDDLIGLIPFIEELSTCGKPFKGFSPSVLENSAHLTLPLHSIAVYLKSTPKNKLCHRVICPLFSLKYQTSVGIFELNKKSQTTYYYGFNSRYGHVECLKERGYKAIQFQEDIIYLSITNKEMGYYRPSQAHKMCNRSRLDTLDRKFSHLSSTCLQQSMSLIAKAHNITILSVDDPQEHSLMPHETTVILHSHIIQDSSLKSTYTELIQRDIKQHALIIIFPYNQYLKRWDSCIMHHPSQNLNEQNAQYRFCQMLPAIKDCESYHTLYMKGITPEDCEIGFYLILYMIVSHNTKSLGDFQISMNRLNSESNLHQKTREWVHQVMSNQRESKFIPQWLKEIFMK